MSDVRLSNGSPTLERTDPRVSDHPKPSACRNLFGPVDHEELKGDLKRHLREMEEAASAKWGFDFANHTPMANGRFQWELVDCRNIPSFYSGEPWSKKGVCSAGNNNVDLNGNHNCVVAPSEDSDRSDGQMECTEQCTGMRKRAACHEPPAQSKRSHTSSEEVSCPSLSQPAEHTPRKTSPKTQT
ncbi:cyclin dependent kinase inhibitor 1Bb [Mastacembelus armatus]|uniref:Cyclin-dependent kinase inhibitor 1B n=1 Tax=Mastacembelus armatus TaxID=205130 RepID=A0A3Q3T1H0_9TELE|nr:cyclin-dependent kinase inhibitor 1B [Mastacembelus armatus]